MPPSKHAVLSASSSARWLACPPSVRYAEKFPDSTSVFAQEGQLAHEIAELKLRKHFTTDITPRTFTSRYKKLKADTLYQTEMDTHTENYLDYIKDLATAYPMRPFLAIEAQLAFSPYVPDGFGTGDALVIGYDADGTCSMDVVDFKYGKGLPVSAVENSQMKLYALGALKAYEMFYEVDRIRLHIVQPRIQEAPEMWETCAKDIFDWASQVVQPIAEQAFEGKGEFCAGTHCRFCRGKAQCATRMEAQACVMEGYSALPAPNVLTDDQIADLLMRAKPFATWIKDVEDYALQAMLGGRNFAGFKLVEGRSNRKLIDFDAVLAQLLAHGLPEDLFYERKPLTLSAMEKVVGKKEFADIAGDHIVHPAGAPTIVPESDKRPPYNPAVLDFAQVCES